MNIYQNTQNQILQTFEYIKDKYSKQDIEKFLYPDRVIKVNIPVKMDNGEVKVFTWYRTQHDNTRGHYKWWIRFHPEVTEEETNALAIWMTIKTAITWIPLGWGKWWIQVNPKELSKNEKTKLARWYVQKIWHNIGEEKDSPAPDINTDSSTMAAMQDEYNKLTGWNYLGTFTWKPTSFGGSQWRQTATSHWWFYVLKRYLNYENKDLKQKKVIIQWAWNAALWVVKSLKAYWAKIVWISDSQWGIYNEKGIDIDEIINLKSFWESVIKIHDYTQTTNQELIEKPCDILILAAMENQITKENANNIQSDYILELANWPVDGDADKILSQKNIIVLPDVVSNSWGVIVSYFEQVQNKTNFYRTYNEVSEKLEDFITSALDNVIETSKYYQTNLRNWSYILALEKLIQAQKSQNQ